MIEYDLIEEKNHNIVKSKIGRFLQLGEFLAKRGCFSNIPDRVRMAADYSNLCGISYSPKVVWARFACSHFELSKIALAILSICPHEASVERSFSAMSDIHTLDRNRLCDRLIEAEMILKWNY